MNARPGEPDRQPGQVPDGEVSDDVPHDPAAATWVPPERPEGASRPAWLPPGSRPGEPYGPPPGEAYGESYGEAYGAPPPLWRQQSPYGGQPLYGAQPPYGGQAPYGAQPGYRKPRVPRWAKVVLVVGIVLYVLSAVGQVVNLLVIQR